MAKCEPPGTQPWAFAQLLPDLLFLFSKHSPGLVVWKQSRAVGDFDVEGEWGWRETSANARTGPRGVNSATLPSKSTAG